MNAMRRIDNDDVPWAVKLTPQRGPLFPYIELLGCNSRALMYGRADILDREERQAPPCSPS